MLTIQKSYSFCYGHRIWNQELSSGECRCVNLHGHNGKVEVELKAETLHNGMVIDFNELKIIKTFIDENIDHKFIIDIDDPLLKSWLLRYKLDLGDLIVGDAGFVLGRSVTMLGSKRMDKSEAEFFRSLVIVPFVPTSENLALWMFSIVEMKVSRLNQTLNLHVKVKRVRWWETETSYSEVG